MTKIIGIALGILALAVAFIVYIVLVDETEGDDDRDNPR